MITRTDILAYAQNNATFTCRDLLAAMAGVGKSSLSNSVTARLTTMVKAGLLHKTSHGVYQLSPSGKSIFLPDYDAEMTQLDDLIQRDFPFIDYCVWNISNVKRLAHHVANLDVIFIDVESVATEAVFNRLNGSVASRSLYLRPSETDYERYIIGRPTIVVRPLISQAPLIQVPTGQKSASIEKILADTAIDPDFFGFQGAQIFDIYETAFQRYTINTSKMLRYASRRGRKHLIQHIIAEISN